MNKQSGLTLVELLVVLVIISVSIGAYSLLKHIISYKTNLDTSDIKNEIVLAKNMAISKKIPHIVFFENNQILVVADNNYSGERENTDTVVKSRTLNEISFDTKNAEIPGNKDQRYVIFTPSGGISDSTLKNGTAKGSLQVVGKNNKTKTLNFRITGYVKAL